jgi:hypothetical protein
VKFDDFGEVEEEFELCAGFEEGCEGPKGHALHSRCFVKSVDYLSLGYITMICEWEIHCVETIH